MLCPGSQTHAIKNKTLKESKNLEKHALLFCGKLVPTRAFPPTLNLRIVQPDTDVCSESVIGSDEVGEVPRGIAPRTRSAVNEGRTSLFLCVLLIHMHILAGIVAVAILEPASLQVPCVGIIPPQQDWWLNRPPLPKSLGLLEAGAVAT